ncbi:MAG: 1,6-anhydro-N-acetylmuramyl-L-alanine amidase AmpD [Burkholderiaceae bacterium]|nr:1,6-anhydro-N-acetylmuramyl-L-alanine amidase AmpD [Burkholderiaceae bacterium]MDO7669432.1 1,6-anhydro-N-acetylmuramyl-L-alanine amidase AmpD [Burkholderiaceae bacterium]MDO7693770.1 1,6-anhydro-N-acetylmuramyl-L-alanine amidase AmpD [Burkholderiaceae bacterium]
MKLPHASAALSPHDATWQDGWWSQATAIPSPNFGPRPAGMAIDLVVIHSISLPPGEFGTPFVVDLFTNRLDWDAHPYFQTIRGAEVSAHFFIQRDGSLIQFVSADQRAWHAGASSWQGRSNCNDYTIGIELEGLEGGRFEQPQYDCLQSLLGALRLAYPTLTDMVGHEDVAPGRKFDPGVGFDWAFFVDKN